MILYVDAGTKKNGQRGKQETTICVADTQGKIIFERYIGDFTNNEGEILAILAALLKVQTTQVKEIYSDSVIAVNWVKKGWKVGREQKHARRVGVGIARRLVRYISLAHNLYILSEPILVWIPREKNKAGWYLEDKYKI